jgi:hypothetical protein
MMTGSDFGLRHGGDRHEPLAPPLTDASAVSVKAPTTALAAEGSKTQVLIYESSREPTPRAREPCFGHLIGGR